MSFFSWLLIAGISGALTIVAGALLIIWDLGTRWIEYRRLLAQLGVPYDWEAYEREMHSLDTRIRILLDAHTKCKTCQSSSRDDSFGS